MLNVGGSGAGALVLRRAAARIGTPYAYGGGGPGGPGRGFCDDGNGFLRGRCTASSTVGFGYSSLVQYAYWPHTQLPRTAAAQYEATAHRPVTRGELRPDDLLFWARRNTPATAASSTPPRRPQRRGPPARLRHARRRLPRRDPLIESDGMKKPERPGCQASAKPSTH
ncbi:NlpC/P60 family protein [Streptomyces sp. MMS21 TC-5]|nr:NlpC/P60 family protein [Streptomyces sp. MMS21 TC-5]